MAAFRPSLEDARTLLSKQLNFRIMHQSAAGTPDPKNNRRLDWVEPELPVICNLVHKDNNKIICTGRGTDDASAFSAAITELQGIPQDVLDKTEMEMAMEIVQLRRKAAQQDADKMAKPTQHRTGAAAAV